MMAFKSFKLDKVEKALSSIAEKMEGSLKVGWMENAKYPDLTYVAQVAAWNEYGTSKSPPRPFIRNMINKESDKWADTIQRAATAFDYNGHQVLSQMGLVIQEDLQQAIVDFSDPRNADSTIAKKGFNKPLIDTGHMKDSITYLVDE